LRFGDLVLDLASRRLSYKNKNIELTMKEFELLRYLMIHPKEVLSRDQILENVWGDEFQGESNVIEVYIRYLRLKWKLVVKNASFIPCAVSATFYANLNSDQ